MIIIIAAVLFVFGLIFGSFAGAQLWRLRAEQLRREKTAGEVVDDRELSRLTPLMNRSLRNDRSRCLSCGHTLGGRDLLPLVSWLSTSGKCRYCKKPIGLLEPTIELAVGAAFAVSLLLWPLPLDSGLAIAQFGVWLVGLVLLAILFAYDAKWFLLPDKIVFPLIGVSFAYALLDVVQSVDVVSSAVQVISAVAVLAGIYWVLWLVSRGRWVGFGDVKLGVALGLLVGSWQLAFLALFLANLIGTLLVLPAITTKRMNRTTQVPFGPLLIAGFLLSFFFGQAMIDWYLSVTTTLVL